MEKSFDERLKFEDRLMGHLEIKLWYNEHSVRGGAAVPAVCHGNFLKRLKMFVKFKWVGCARTPRWKSPQTPPTTSTDDKQIFSNCKLPLNCSRKQSRPSLTADIRRVVQQSWYRLVEHRSLDQLGIPVFLEIFHLTPAAKKLFHYSEKVRLFSLSNRLSGTHCKAHLFVDCRLNFEDIKRLIFVLLLNLFYSFFVYLEGLAVYFKIVTTRWVDEAVWERGRGECKEILSLSHFHRERSVIGFSPCCRREDDHRGTGRRQTVARARHALHERRGRRGRQPR